MRRARHTSGGFTLVEVMIALAILAVGLVFLLRSSASNVYAAQKAQMLTAATSLARAKMYDIEEKLLADGYQELDQIEEGDFGDDGWDSITWKVEIVKIELPDMASLQSMAGGAAGEEGATGAAPGGMLGGMLGGMGAGAGGEATDPASAASAGVMGTYYTLVADVLKDAIRKVTLTVSYPVLGTTESFVVTCYFTDPATVNRKIPGTGGVGGEEAGGEEGGQPGSQPGGQPSGQPGGQPSGQPGGRGSPTRGPRGVPR